MLLARLLKVRIRGALPRIDARGVAHGLGRQVAGRDEIVVRPSDRGLHHRLLIDPERPSSRHS
jgi:hypothetical protein